ncbi:MAG: mechanosensitive ion channel family protein [Myxacorys californica WJT36-NPBG1]|jgi:small conductance mechanosensitive channel|nr:mechanosensitive ion channel family protein [Myxacorys californica WJT36-NPBG1]
MAETEGILGFSLNFPQPVFENQLSNLAFQCFKAIAILLLTRWGAITARHLTFRLLKYAEPTLQKFLAQMSGILVWMIGVVAALNTVGIQTTTVVAVVGAAGLAIGLALQNSLSHFAAGILLVSFRPFEVGDAIEGAGVAGLVDNIGLFSTTILTADHVRITVPNSNLFSGTLKNNTVMGTRRVDLTVDIGDRVIDSTITQLLSLLQDHPLILQEPKTTCHVDTISATTTTLYLRPWCAASHYEQVKSEVLQIAKESLSSSSKAEGVDNPRS